MSLSSVVLAVGGNPFNPAGGATKDASNSFLDAIGSSFCTMAADMASSVFGFASQKTAVDLNKNYVVENYNAVFGIALLVLVGVFLCACIVGAVRGDPHVITRALAATVTAILGSFVALTLLDMVLHASDGMANAFGAGKPLGQDLVAQLRALPARGNVALDIVMSLLVALFSFSLFLVLYVRKIAIIAVAIFIPLYLAGQPAMLTRGWVKRAVEVLMALVFTKPVIYAVFVLGAGIAGDTGGSPTDQTLSILAGVVVMVAAIFTPLALLYLIGFAETQAISAFSNAGRKVGRAAASFGKGAGSTLGSSSRETFRGVGERLQSRRPGVGAGAGTRTGAGVASSAAARRRGGLATASAGRASGAAATAAGATRSGATRSGATSTGASAAGGGTAAAVGGSERGAGGSTAPVARPSTPPPASRPAPAGAGAPAPGARPAAHRRESAGGGTPATRTRVSRDGGRPVPPPPPAARPPLHSPAPAGRVGPPLPPGGRDR